jgi:hypothetical protein
MWPYPALYPPYSLILKPNPHQAPIVRTHRRPLYARVLPSSVQPESSEALRLRAGATTTCRSSSCLRTFSRRS